MLVAAFVAGSFLASPEFKTNPATTLGSIEIVKGEVKATNKANFPLARNNYLVVLQIVHDAKLL
jgi:hypothetical protein